jgi:hypothetical protein
MTFPRFQDGQIGPKTGLNPSMFIAGRSDPHVNLGDLLDAPGSHFDGDYLPSIMISQQQNRLLE